MSKYRQLERAAQRAAKAGWTWQRFWAEHSSDVRTAEPIDRGKYHRLANRLLGIVMVDTSRDEQGDPWVDDDTAGTVNSFVGGAGVTA